MSEYDLQHSFLDKVQQIVDRKVNERKSLVQQMRDSRALKEARVQSIVSSLEFGQSLNDYLHNQAF
jgi:regulator of sigma D